MGLSNELRDKADPIFQKIFAHSFIQGVGNGSLGEERFRYYVEQDYLFLIEYSRALALAVASGRSLSTMSWFATLLSETLNTEMEMHRSYAAQFGISRASLAEARLSPTTYAYTSHLVALASHAGVGGVACALLPCQWSYSEIGQMLARKGKPQNNPLYCQWIDMYSSAAFASTVDTLRNVVDLEGDGMSVGDLAQAEQLFLTSARYEYLFWDAAYRLERWPV